MGRNYPYQPAKNTRLDASMYACVGQPVFVTIRAFQGSAPFQEEAVCRMAVKTLLDQAEMSHCRIHVYGLMPDHLHFLVSPREDGYSVLDFVGEYKGRTTHLFWEMGYRGKLWQPRFYDHVVRAEEDIRAIGEYILRNPIRKGLVESVDDWPWLGIP